MSQTLTLGIAQQQVDEASSRLVDDSLYTITTDETAEALTMHKGSLSLNGMTSLSDSVAETLTNCQPCV
jgi:hypothetical protein